MPLRNDVLLGRPRDPNDGSTQHTPRAYSAERHTALDPLL
jgi:hypothetical protein